MACAVDAASLAECTPGGAAPDEEWDPRTASLSVGRSGTFTAEQRTNAATIIKVGKQLGVSARGQVVALAVAEQESGIRALTYGDRDSIGVFQQRNAWGSRAARLDVARSAHMFYTGGAAGQRGLLDIAGWESMSIARAGQAVQVSAFPDAYAKWEDEARQLVSELGDLDVVQPTTPAPRSEEAPDVQCVAPTGSPENPTGEIVMASVAGMRRVKDPTSGITYNIPMPGGSRSVAMEYAIKQLGKPYVWAAQGPNGFDCSGLTHKAWGAAGEDVFPQTETLVRQERHVSRPQPGDLIYHPGHVQMFMGRIGGKEIILEAPRTGLKVRIVEQWYTGRQTYLDPTTKGV